MPGFIMSALYLGLLITINHYSQRDAMALGLVLLIVSFGTTKRHHNKKSKISIMIDVCISLLTLIFMLTRLVYGHLWQISYIYFLGGGNRGNAPGTRRMAAIIIRIITIAIGYYLYINHHIKRTESKNKRHIYTAILIIYSVIFGRKTIAHYYKHDSEITTESIPSVTQVTEGMNKKPNVIILFMESVNAAHSAHYGTGWKSSIPKRDALIKEKGVIRKNIMANGCTSDAGQYSLLYGHIPHTYINGQGFYNTNNINTPSLATIFNKAQYETTFISAAPMSFLQQKEFIKNAGFTNIIDDQYFKEKPLYVFDSAPDEYLYEKIIKQTQKTGTPQLIVAPTISTHKPYNSPYGKTKEAVYRYTDDTLSTFIEDLDKEGFFKKGILIMVGDHRSYDEMTNKELKIRGESAYGRVAGAMIAPSYIKPGTQIDHIIDQTDIFYTLQQLVSSRTYPTPVFNNPITAQYTRPRSVRFCNRIENREYITHEKFQGFTENIKNTAINKWLIMMR